MEKKTIETLRGEIEVSTFAKEGVEVITFNSLKQAMSDMNVSLSVPTWGSKDLFGYPFCSVVLTDVTSGITYTGTGHANPNTLEDKISKANVVNICVNRAESDAILRYLGLSGRYYTNEQISDIKDEADSKSETDKADKKPKYQQASEKSKAEPEKETPKAKETPKQEKPAPKAKSNAFKGKTLFDPFAVGA